MSEEKEESMVWAWAVVIGGLLLVLCFFLNTCAGDGRPEGLRGTLSADWHHIGCMFSLCDQDGRCPVWSSKFSKCYMLEKKELEHLKYFEKEKAGKGDFELYMIEVHGRKL